MAAHRRSSIEVMKNALVTGGSRGIGLGIAQCLLANGWNVAINGVRDASRVSDVLQALEGLGGQVVYAQGNVAEEADRRRLVSFVTESLGPIHALVNNAGVAPKQRLDLLETTIESYDRVMNINLRGPFFLSQLVANQMVDWKAAAPDQDFCIVNVTSVSAVMASQSRGEYCISKAGMSMMSKLFAVKLSEYDIPVYEIQPGITRTDMTSTVEEKYTKMLEEGLALQRRWGTPEDVGKAVLSLVRGDLPYSTGQIIVVDGGMMVERL